MYDLSSRTALVCGASRGIGAAAAVELADMGARVVVLARTAEALETVKSELKPARDHKPHIALAVDINNRAELSQKIDQLLKETGPINILVNNTGGPKAGPIANAEEDAFLKAFEQHVLVNQLLTQKLLPGMKDSKYGRIINVISTSVKVPIPNLGVSNTIRGAVASWAKTMASELGPFGITVNNVLPGFTATDRLENLKQATADRLGISVPEVEDKWKATIPLGRFAYPKELGMAIAFLASPSAAYINGINLPVDGGRTGTL